MKYLMLVGALVAGMFFATTAFAQCPPGVACGVSGWSEVPQVTYSYPVQNYQYAAPVSQYQNTPLLTQFNEDGKVRMIVPAHLVEYYKSLGWTLTGRSVKPSYQSAVPNGYYYTPAPVSGPVYNSQGVCTNCQ